MKIRTRVIIVGSVSIALALVMVIILGVTTARIRNLSEDRRLAIAVTESILELHSSAVDFALNLDNASLVALENAVKGIDASIAVLSPRLTGSMKTTLGDISKRNRDASEIVAGISGIHPGPMPREAGIAAENMVMDQADEMLEGAQKIRESIVGDLLSAESLETTMSIILLGIIVILMTGISILVSVSVTRPLAALQKGTEIIAAGDLGYRIDLQRKDEIGMLSDSFNSMAGKLEGSFTDLEREVAERKHAEAELAEKNVELEDFAHTVSHDIKGPLATAAFAAQTLNMILAEPPDEDRAKRISEITEIINQKIESASLLIDNILALAEAGRIPTEVEDVSVAQAVEMIVVENSWVMDRKGIEVKVDPDLGTVRANPTHIYQVFSNLITNSIKYCDSDTPVIRIEYLGESEGGGRRYRVSDNGPGITPDDLEQIFSPFFTGHTGGTGIGLAIVVKILEIYGGEIHAYNRNGANFEFAMRDLEPESTDTGPSASEN